MPTRRLTSIWEVLIFYVAGLLTGVQLALYLFDVYDDGVAEPASGFIGLLFFGAGVAAIAWRWRGGREAS